MIIECPTNVRLQDYLLSQDISCPLYQMLVANWDLV